MNTKEQGALTYAQIIERGHRMAWRYKHSSDPAHSSTYTFNGACLLDFARAIEAEATRRERERARGLVNAEIADAWQRAYFDPHILALGIEAEVMWREKERARGLVEALEVAVEHLYNPFEPDNQSRVYGRLLAALAAYRSQS